MDLVGYVGPCWATPCTWGTPRTVEETFQVIRDEIPKDSEDAHRLLDNIEERHLKLLAKEAESFGAPIEGMGDRGC